MADYIPNSLSPRVLRTSPQTLAQYATPITPVHSPHHSVTSSVSSRTPIHTLSIHEYRKQQNTPGSQTVTPSGKTLRRKPAAPALNGLERAPSVTRLPPASSFRPLHLSQSAHHLQSHRSPSAQQQLADLAFRSQSAEPRTQGGSISSISTTTSSGKVRYFNSRKRLPKPPLATGSVPLPPHLAFVKTTVPRRSPFSTGLELSTESSRSSDVRTPHTASTFSLSRFPQPPHLIDPSFSSPYKEDGRTRINALSFASTAPATPPATPATIHYRGASFDLVNPHDSLLLHDIVTPSRDFGSSEYLAVPTSEESFLESADMAPKRALYGDFTTAHAGILRRVDGSFSSSNHDLPLPPTPAAVSPNSSSYTSPSFSPDSNLAPLPLALNKISTDSRFSLKGLTRTLTKKLGKTPEKQHEQELQELRSPVVQNVSDIAGIQPTYVATPQSAYFPLGPTSPITPTSPMSPQECYYEQDENNENNEVEFPRKHPVQHYDSAPLTSLIPDQYSTQMGLVDDPRTSMSEGHLLSRPYYDDLDSIYPSSSVYTGDGRRISDYQHSLASTRQSNPFLRYSGIDASSFDNEHNIDSAYGYSVRSKRKSNPLTQKMFRRMDNQEKTDTIGKIIDQYDPYMVPDSTMSIQSQGTVNHQVHSRSGSIVFDDSLSADHAGEVRAEPGFSDFEFGLGQGDLNYKQSLHARRPTIARDVRLPPREPAPLAPPFQYDEAPFVLPHPDTSGMFSDRSSNSYGDTRNLLQIPPSDGLTRQMVQPSSSYSQPDAKPLETSSSYSEARNLPSPQTPKEALDQAEQIFQSAADGQQLVEKGIPAIWARRSSGSMLVGKKATSQNARDSKHLDSPAAHQFGEGTEADWESDGGNSRAVRDSFSSIADYSSSEGTRNSLGLDSNVSLPSWQNISRGPSVYIHPSPIRAHHHPFSSSPPSLLPGGRLHAAPQSSSPPLASSPQNSRTVPVFRLVTQPKENLGRGAVEQPYAHAPWADRYAFSDKETLELLASGPNDKIMFEYEGETTAEPNHKTPHGRVGDVMLTSSSPVSAFDGAGDLERENTFEKLCLVGPKGNLTGTPRGTGMHETGSSVADTSSPGLTLTSSALRHSYRSMEYPGFYATPIPATGSVTRIQQSRPPEEPEYERTPSQYTLFPRIPELEPVVETSPKSGASHRPSLRCSTTFQHQQRRVSRTAAVPGQTKLRQMLLSPESSRKTLSSAGTNFSHFMGGNERPSTSDTNTPLHPQLSVPTLPTARTFIAHQHSPHLLCPERVPNAEDEERRRKLSWAILAVFCLLPPCIILYRLWGDSLMISLTKGKLGYCTNKSKKAALMAGITINIGIATAIVVSIAVAHALGAA
ncbi:hypothetical protein CC86DRAFT_121214 [Ophiobolus disseminans]|uniref:Uncharacterized protein n=1 Tax=Ophiobolus disseminans TaxID=1469910 RepID=A0A6A6ZHV4_9PLEO|nr:hypothetical protein CC86DRAFT_121214 [Ophiobolus disseminans]